MNRYLYRQNDPTVAALPYGRLRRQVADAGCALVAIYNLMNRLGQTQEFSAIIKDAQRLHMPWLFGLFGTKPHAPARYFREKSIPFFCTNHAEAFKEQLADCDAAIICAWNKPRRYGIHFYLICNDNGRLTALNRFANDNQPTVFSPDDVEKGYFITGYIFPKEKKA